MMAFDLKQIQETNAFSCLECGKCTGTCPVARYSKMFSPRQILSHSIHDSHPDAYSSAQLWSCLTCQQCDEICPSDIKYIDLIQLLRQFKGIENREATCSHGGILESISRIMTTPDLKQDRLGWVTKNLKTSRDSEYLYFTGCLPYFQALFSDLKIELTNIARSTLKILNYFDITPQLLANEKCCGHDFYWNGDMDNFKKLATANIEQINQSGIKKVITACPECYRTLKLDYPKQFGSQQFEVIHISEFLSQKISEKKLELKSQNMKVTFQDPCRLGRHMKEYDAPRDVLNSLKGIEFKEMAHHHKRAICCGVSGWMNCSQISKSIQSQRLREAVASGADTLVTSCAKCQIHFTCAMQDENLSQDIKLKIKDLTELFAENLT
jgi:Fe-S oxidoreductase